MTTHKNETFGALLTAAISYIAACEHKTSAMIEEELGAALGVAGKTVQRYKSGVLPPADHSQDRIRILAETIVTRRIGSLGREWLERFLHAARYPAAEKLLDELTPAHAPRPKPERVYENLPAPTYDQFVPRQQAFDEVVDGLSQRSAAVLIVGLGGNGKTSLAREVAAHCLQDEDGTSHFDSVVWVSDKDHPGTTNQSTVLDTIARTLDYPGFTQFAHDEKQYEVEQLLRRQKVLLIIDNAETITDGALFTWLLRLPEPSKAIITTREYHRLLRRNSTPIELRGMSGEEAHTLLHQRLERLRIAHLVHDPTQLEPLLAAAGGNPKAITMIAGLLKYERRPLQQIIDDLYAARGDLFDDLFSRAWALLDEAGKRTLMVMTFFPDSASVEALSATADVIGFDFDRAIERLTDLSLLDVQQTDLASAPRYVLHPLVRSFAAAQLVEQPDFEKAARERWVRWCVAMTESVIVWKDMHWTQQLSSEMETIYAALLYAIQRNQSLYWSQAACLAEISAAYYSKQGPWSKNMASRLLRAQIARALHDIDGEISALSDYVESASLRGEFDKAEERLGEIQRNVGNAHDVPSIACKVQQALVVYYYHQDKVEQALAITEDIKRIVSHEADLPATRQPWNLYMYARCLYKLGRVEEAQQGFLDALQDAVRVGYIRGQIFPRIQLASIALDDNRGDEAERFLADGQTLAHRSGDRRLLGPVHHLYARLYTLRGEFSAAHATLTEAIDLFERMGMRRELAEAREELARLEAQMAEAAE